MFIVFSGFQQELEDQYLNLSVCSGFILEETKAPNEAAITFSFSNGYRHTVKMSKQQARAAIDKITRALQSDDKFLVIRPAPENTR